MRLSSFLLLSLLLLFNLTFCYGQINDSSAYFPCAVGNKWQWVTEGDTSKTTIEITRDSIGIDGTKFLFYNGDKIPSYKIDTLRRVFQFLNKTDSLGHTSLGSPILLYKLDAQAGDSFYIGDSGTVAKVTIYPSTIFGHTVNIKQFSWYILPANYWFMSTSLAWGFGQIGTGGLFTESVAGCRIDGVDYGSLLSVRESNTIFPKDFRLEQNYPNPFNPSTVIGYQLPSAGWVRMNVYDLLGQLVATIVDRYELPGYHEVSWTPNVAGGVYYYKLQTNQLSQTKMLLLLK